MSTPEARRAPPRVIVISDAEGNAEALIERVLRPAGIHAWPEPREAPPPDLLVVDITQLRGDPLAGLRTRREAGDESPAIVLAAHFPTTRLRDLFRLGVGDILLKPVRPVDLIQAVFDMAESRTAEANTKLLARRLEGMREHVRRLTEEMRLLSEIGRAVVSLSDLDVLLRRVVEAAAYLTQGEEANLYLADPESQDVVLRASKQAGEKQATLPRLRTTDTLAGQVYRSGQPIMRQPAREGGPVKVQTGFLVQSLIMAPLRMQDQVVGVLGVYNRLAPRPFTDHHLTLLQALAAWSGVGLEHAALVRQSRSQQATDSKAVEASQESMRSELGQARILVDPLLRGDLGPLSAAQRAQLKAVAEHLGALAGPPPAARATIRPGDLSSLLRAVAEELQPSATRQGLDVLVDPGQPDVAFAGDPERARHVVEGLAASAVARTATGKVVLSARPVQVRQGNGDGENIPPGVRLTDGSWAVVAVTDTGPGLSPDAIRALHTTKPDPALGPIGPGLTMGELRLIAESLGGALWHDRAAGGTRMVLALPVR